MVESFSPDSRLVILDDDPTGIQTVHGCLAATQWTRETLVECLTDRVPFFYYILTNTRSMNKSHAEHTIREVVRAVRSVALELGIGLTFLVRSDSTLRGHFPLEINTVVDELGMTPDARLFVPAFFEAGRITEHNSHWIRTPDGNMPCSESAFARDSVFGYSSSHLPDYLEEKGAARAEDVVCLDAAGDLSGLMDLEGGPWCITNVRTYQEMDRLTSEIRRASAAGRKFAFQSSSSFPKSLTGTPDTGLVRFPRAKGPGIVIVGSHVVKSTRQLAALLDQCPEMQGVELPVEDLERDDAGTIATVLTLSERAARVGKTPVVFTSRSEQALDGGQRRLELGERITAALCAVVRDLPFVPSFVVSKGGITSHEVMRRGLDVNLARSLGQAAPGVPVLSLPDDHRWAGIPYIIFPGNVGDDDTLADVCRRVGARKELA